MSLVMCHMSRVTCHISHVTCHVSHVRCHMYFFFYLLLFFVFFSNKVVKIIGGGSVIHGAYPVYFFVSHLKYRLRFMFYQLPNRHISMKTDYPALYKLSFLAKHTKMVVWLREKQRDILYMGKCFNHNININ